MAEHGFVQNSEVFILGGRQAGMRSVIPPPSPPSPGAAGDKDDALCTPIQELSLDDVMIPVRRGKGVAAVLDDVSSQSSSSVPASASDHRPSPPSPVTTAQTAASSVLASPSLASSDLDPNCNVDVDRLAAAIHVLSTEAHALQAITKLYSTSPTAREGFHHAVEAIVHTQTSFPTGKLVIIGVGKSGHIGHKLAATFNSLAVPASFVHPTEALHGDLGHIRANDALLFITYSGKTQELVSLLPHVDPALPLILLTAHVTTETCALVQHRNEFHRSAKAVGPTILLPAPIPVEEKVSFGVSAPTTSTTTALAVGDALAIVSGNELHAAVGGVGSVFQRNHPGGAIGDATLKQGGPGSRANQPIRELAVPWPSIPTIDAGATTVCADVLRAGYHNAQGWVRIVGADSNDNPDGVVPPSRIRALDSADMMRHLANVPGLVVGQPDFVVVSADTKAGSAAQWLRRSSLNTGSDVTADAVIAVVDHKKGGELVGVLELRDLLRV